MVCITAGEPEQFEEVFGNQTNTKGKVTVYEIKDNPMTSGGRYLSFHVVDDIGVEGPRDVEIWCVSNILDPRDYRCCVFIKKYVSRSVILGTSVVYVLSTGHKEMRPFA